MAGIEFRLLGTALVLGRFTKAKLAKAADVNPNTVASWLRRNSRFMELEGPDKPATPGPGRPRKTWRVREGAAVDMRRVLDQLQPSTERLTMFDLRGKGHLRTLDRVESHLADWHRAMRFGDHAAASQELVAAKTWIRLTWEDFAELERAGFEVPAKQLKHLAELEREAGCGAPPEAQALPNVAVWVAQRMSNMIGRGVRDNFAARVIRIRTEVRSEVHQVLLTAASSAAPVWADEGLAEEGDVTEEALQRCGLVAQVVPAGRRVQELSIAIGRFGWSFCSDAEESQAVVLGLAMQYQPTTELEVGDWLSGLHVREEWRPELAPAVVRGLAEAPRIILPALMRSIEDQLQQVLCAEPLAYRKPGKVRMNAIEFSRRALDIHRKLPNLSQLDPQAAKAMFAYRPHISQSAVS